MTYKVHTSPSPEVFQLQASMIPEASPSSVKPFRDNYQEIILLNGKWKYKQMGGGIEDLDGIDQETSYWHSMEIPKNWFLEGLNYHGVIWFQRSFPTDPNWRGRFVQLKFDGVDYLADVWLNGVKIGSHEGYFQPFMFDITDELNFDGENILVVRVESPYEEYKTVWPFRKTLIKGIFAHSSYRPGDPWGSTGQEYNTGGIWNDVSLVISDFLTIKDIQIQSTWPTTQTIGIDPWVDTSISIENHADITIDADIKLTFIPKNHSGNSISIPIKSASLPRGKRTINLSGIAANPLLWWSWDRGNPNLYTAQIDLISDKKILAQKEITYGFRQINITEDWIFYLNGIRFFPRGSNYISSQWLSETDTDWYKRDSELILGANLNFIRLLAHIEPGEFYEAMDETGILVWQDFPLQWGYSDAPAFIDGAQRQLKDMIRILYNHPSIAIWCMHNGGSSDSPWLAEEDRDYNPTQNRRLDQLLFNLASGVDPTRYIHKNSGSGDNHIYIGWDSGQWTNLGDWSMLGDSGQNPPSQPSTPDFNLPGGPFLSEYGAQALPNIEMMSAIFSPEELLYASGEVRDRWEFHNFQPTETFNIARIDSGNSVQEFIQNSQTYQANLIKFATENYRRAKYNPIQGIFYAMFADPWPSISFSVLDYNRQPKYGYASLKSAMQPILPSIFPNKPAGVDGISWVYEDPDDFSASLWVVNDTLGTYSDAKLSWRIDRESNHRVTFGEIHVDVAPDSSHRFWTVSSDRISEGMYKLFVTLSTQDGQVLGENELEFTILPPIEESSE